MIEEIQDWRDSVMCPKLAELALDLKLSPAYGDFIHSFIHCLFILNFSTL